MTKVFNKRNAKRVTAILLAVVAVVSSIFIIPTASAAGKEVTVDRKSTRLNSSH